MPADLTPPDTFHLAAAQGWLELGNHLEAQVELNQIMGAHGSHPDVLAVRWQICARLGQWNACHSLATAIMVFRADRVEPWLLRAYSLRRCSNGSLELARAVLMEAWTKFPNEPTVAYNLACYEAQLADVTAAKHWFDTACKIGNARAIRQRALEDSDLEPLWDLIEK